MAVVVRTHGGLGNQLFQIFFARLVANAKGTEYGELHDLNYPHRFTRSSIVPLSSYACSPTHRALSRLRIPKLLKRVGLSRRESVSLGRDVYLDGYFQEVEDYSSFSDAMIRAQIERLRRELGIEPQSARDFGTLYHIRLGDFFNAPAAARQHALERVEQLEPHSTVVTNQEDVFADGEIRQLMEAKHCRVHPSNTYTPEDVLRLMTTYCTIVTNNSTLAFWASVLGNCKTNFDDPRLFALHKRLFHAANG